MVESTAIPFTSNTLPSETLLTALQAATMLGVRPGTLEQWRSQARYGLPYVKVGRLVRYRRSDIEAFLARRTMACLEVLQ